MLMIPGPEPLKDTKHSRELGRRVEEIVRDYQRDHPEMTEAEVRAALMQSKPGDSPALAARKRILGVAIGAAVAGGFVAMATTGGGANTPVAVGWGIAGIIAAAGAVAVMIIRLVRRD